MIEIVCLSCMTWHFAPMCEHDAEARCVECGGSVGYRWLSQNGAAFDAGGRCWRCVTGISRAPSCDASVSVISVFR